MVELNTHYYCWSNNCATTPYYPLSTQLANSVKLDVKQSNNSRMQRCSRKVGKLWNRHPGKERLLYLVRRELCYTIVRRKGKRCSQPWGLHQPIPSHCLATEGTGLVKRSPMYQLFPSASGWNIRFSKKQMSGEFIKRGKIDFSPVCLISTKQYSSNLLPPEQS